MTGRNTVRTPELVAELCEHIESPMPVRHACAMVGIHEGTFYRWMQEAERDDASQDLREFREAIARARATASDKLKAVIMRAATGYTVTKLSGSGVAVDTEEFDWKAAAWLAERMFPDEFGNRQKIEHSVGAAGDDENAIDFDEATEQAARDLIRKATGYGDDAADEE